MTEQEVKDALIETGFEETILYTNPSYSKAFVGVSSDGIAIYDRTTVIQCLVEEGMDEMDALEWVDYNCIGSRGHGLPIVIDVINPLFGGVGV